MVTIRIEPIAIAKYKKKPNKYGFEMKCYFEEFLFKTWTKVFSDIQECAHYADGFLFENMIAPESVETIIDNYDLVSNTDLKKISIKGIPYSVNFKPTEKYSIED
jgi:deoxyadenosine/deoxycytidine kinase